MIVKLDTENLLTRKQTEAELFKQLEIPVTNLIRQARILIENGDRDRNGAKRVAIVYPKKEPLRVYQITLNAIQSLIYQRTGLFVSGYEISGDYLERLETVSFPQIVTCVDGGSIGHLLYCYSPDQINQLKAELDGGRRISIQQYETYVTHFALQEQRE